MRRLLAAPTYRYIQGAMLVVLVIAFVTSFESGSAGAKKLGYPEDFVSALPLVCDVIAGVATFIHSRVRGDAPMRRLAGQFVLVPMLLSWGANSVDHVNRAPAGPGWTSTETSAWIAAVVLAAGICPVAVAALLHLSTKYVDFELRQAARAEQAAAEAAAATATSTEGAETSAVDETVMEIPGPTTEFWVRVPTETSPDPEPEQALSEGLDPASCPEPPEAPGPDDEPPPPADRQDPPRLTVAGTDTALNARARELIDEGVPRSTAYRRARKELTNVA